MQNNDTKHILLIEDNDADAELFTHSLTHEGESNYKITHMGTIEEFDASADEDYDVVIMDMRLPGLSGIAALEYMQKRCFNIPIIILTGAKDRTTEHEAAKRGVQDFLVKGSANGDLIDRAIRYSIDRKQYQNNIMYLQQCDRLTGLFSRDVFLTLLSSSLVKAQNKETSLAVFHINIDHFKKINEFYGEDMGNIVINECASRLKEHLGKTHLAARVGADQFLFGFEDLGSMDNYAGLAQNMVDILKEPFQIGEVEIQVTASVGAVYTRNGELGTQDLLKNAERAMRTAKKAGRNCYRFYSKKLDAITESRLFINLALPNAIKNNEFFLCYQPKIDITDGSVIGVETLLRWIHPEKGFISPSEFVPIAEHSGLIHDISMWVMNEIATHATFFADNNMDVAVNISPTELLQEGVVSWLQEASEALTSKQCQLTIELTETAVMHDVDHSLSVLHAIKDMGIKLHIDDFGTGYSSLSYLHKLPVDALKVDRSFVMDMTSDEEDQQIVKLIISLAHGLGITVIAEGVETQEAEQQLKNLGCDYAQGYYYAKPMTMAHLKEWLTKKASSENVA